MGCSGFSLHLSFFLWDKHLYAARVIEQRALVEQDSLQLKAGHDWLVFALWPLGTLLTSQRFHFIINKWGQKYLIGDIVVVEENIYKYTYVLI